MEQEESGINYALQLNNRIRHIDLVLSPSILPNFLVLMDEGFPILEYLSLTFPADKSTTLTLPIAFSAPNLRHLSLFGVKLPKRLRLLCSTASLIALTLWDIQDASYIRPRLLAARLGSLLQLETLSISFSIPIPRPSTEWEMLGEQKAPVKLPSLKTLRFKGVATYLESLLAQIGAPLLEQLDITFFNQIAFALPHLSYLLDISEGFKLPAARVYFDRNEVSIIMAHHSSRWFDGPFYLRVKCKQWDWQIDCVAQICNALIPVISCVEQFKLDFYAGSILSKWQNGAIDDTTWRDLLGPFLGTKELYIDNALLEELSRALQEDEPGLDPGFLPNLQSISARRNLFTSFMDARQVVGRPVEFLSR